MAFFYPSDYNPNSYARALYGSPYSTYRRPSPPPTTYYPRSVDPYIQALAEEQAARSALQDAIQREQEARRHRAEEEARVRALAEQEARTRARAARQRPQTMYGSPYAHGYPAFGFTASDDEDDYEEAYSPYEIFGFGPRRPMHRAPPAKSVPRMARSQSRARPCSGYEHQQFRPESVRQQSPEKQTTEKPVESIKIPIRSPSPSPADVRKSEAASKIQSIYRAYAARKAAFADIESIDQKFESLRASFSFPTSLEFQNDPASPDANATPEERPRLAYTSSNAPVHGYEDGLVKLLQKLDAVESHGDASIRDARRAIVKAIEEELSAVDTNIRRAWEERVNAAKATQEPTATNDAVIETDAEQSEAMDLEAQGLEANAELSASIEATPTDSATDVTIADVDTPEAQETATADAMEVEPTEALEETLVPLPSVEKTAAEHSSEPAMKNIIAESTTVNTVPDIPPSTGNPIPGVAVADSTNPVDDEGSAVPVVSQLVDTDNSSIVDLSEPLAVSDTETILSPTHTDLEATATLGPIIEEPDSESSSEDDVAGSPTMPRPESPESVTIPLGSSTTQRPHSPTNHHVTVEDAPEDDDGEMVAVEEVIEPDPKVQEPSRRAQDSDFVLV